jgi:hypothetical protein
LAKLRPTDVIPATLTSSGIQILAHSAEPLDPFDVVVPIGEFKSKLSVSKLTNSLFGRAFIAKHAVDPETGNTDVELLDWVWAPPGTPTVVARRVVGHECAGGVFLCPGVLPKFVAKVESTEAPVKAAALTRK